MSIPLDYETLRIIWWLLLGVLLIGFAVMDGFDLGTAMLLPFVARTDTERRVTINAIGPFWEGNQVWLILGGGAVFAAWPPVYAAAFSGLLYRDVSGAGGADPAAGRVRFPQQDSPTRAGARSGTTRCSPAASCRASCSAWRSAICCRAYRSASTPICAFSTRAAGCSSCSIHSACSAACYRPRCSPPMAQLYLALKTEGTVQVRARNFVKIGAVVTIVLFAIGGALGLARHRRLRHHQRDRRRTVPPTRF